MTLDVVNAAAGVATLAVLGTTVVAALIQLRHMRASNALAAVLAVEDDFHSRALQSALTYVARDLPDRMRDPAYRAELAGPGYIDPAAHPEMTLCNWFNTTGALVHGGFLDEDLFLNAFGRLVAYYWEQLGPTIAVLRRSRGPDQYARFEYLAARARLRSASGARRAYPRTSPRLPVEDPWAATDRQPDR